MEVPAGWEIPELDPAMAATEVVAPVTTWGAIGRKRPMPGTYGFYTDDFKFTHIWKDPDALIRSGCKVAVEVNYSTFDDSEPEDVLTGVYRKRVLARYWQMHGVQILVDMDVAPNYLTDYGLLGVPRGWRSYATRSHRLSQWTMVESEHAAAVEHAGTADILFVVFGGSRKIHALCEERGFIHIPEHIEVARGRAQPYGGITAFNLWKGISPEPQAPPP